MKTTRHAVLAIGVLLSSWSAASTARADLTIAAPACEALDVREIERVLSIEIEDVAAEWREISAPVVLLGCAEGRVRIEITDPVTDKSVARTVSMPEVDRERVIAIAIAQLFLTSWLELLLDGDEAESPARIAAERMARGAVAEAGEVVVQAETEAESETEAETGAEAEIEAEAETEAEAGGVVAVPGAARIGAEIAIEGGVRWRAEGENLGTALGALRAQVVVDRLLIVGVRAGLEWGRAFRTRGTIDVWTIAPGLVAGARTPELGPFFLDAVVGVAPSVVLLEGRPSSPDVEGGTTQAVAGEALLEIAPSLRAGPVIVALPLSVSGIAFAPNGQVTGEPPIVVGGTMLSAALRVGVDASAW